MRARTIPLGTVVAVVVLLGLAALWVVNCSGPRASASDLTVQPPSSGNTSYQIAAAIHNSGPGHGEIQVTFRLRDTRSGQTYEQTQTVTLDAGETSVVSAQISAPPGDYRPEVDLSYPPG